MNLQRTMAWRAAEPARPASQFSLMWGIQLTGRKAETAVAEMNTAALQTQCLCEIAYLRGDFDRTKHLAAKALDSEDTGICASLFSMLSAISTNDFGLYSRIETALKQQSVDSGEPLDIVLAEIVMATVAVGMFAPEMVPAWLKAGDYSRLPAESTPFALYLRVKYLQNLADYSQMFAVAQTMHALGKGKGTMMEIYLLLMCAAACVGLGDKLRAREYLLEALALGMPHGFLTPFAENIANLSGLVEECVRQHYPWAYAGLIDQWEKTWKNWAIFHNRFARDHVTVLLTLREYRIAALAANRVPYAQIAREECLSIGRVRNIIQEIYGKLFVRNRDELAALVLWTTKKT